MLFLNNDMRFHDHFIECMVAEMVRDPQIFSIDALQYDWEGARTVHLATSLSTERRGEFSGELVPGLYVHQIAVREPGAVLFSSAANMLARKSMFMELGGFDERLPIGCEDVELCWRAWVRGWGSVFTPEAVCWHHVGWSGRNAEGSRIRFRGTLAGRLLLATKLLPFRFVAVVWVRNSGGHDAGHCGPPLAASQRSLHRA